MLHLLILLLKIIGILLLVLLILLLAVTAAVLFVPVRYRFQAEYNGKIDGRGRVTWLLHLLSVRIGIADNHSEYEIRIAGIPLAFFGKLAEKRKKRGRQKAKNVKKTQKAQKVKKAQNTPSAKKAQRTKKAQNTPNTPNTRAVSEPAPKPSETALKPEIPPEPSEAAPPEREPSAATPLEAKPPTLEQSEPASEPSKAAPPEREQPQPTPEQPEAAVPVETAPSERNQPQPPTPEARPGFWSRMKARIFGWLQAVKKFFFGVRDKIRDFFGKVEGWKERLAYMKNYVERILQADYMRPAFTQIVTQLKALFRHLKPKKLSIWLHYGTGDPYTLGQHLTYISILYGFFGEYLEVEPDWDEKVLEAKGNVKGRIRVFTLLRICIKVIKDENIKNLWNEIRQFERS